MCCFTERLSSPDKEHSLKIPQVQCNLTQFPVSNKIRLKAGKRKHQPFANPSGTGERRASHTLLGSRGSGSLTTLFPKILLPTALSAMPSTTVEVIRAAQLTSALMECLVVFLRNVYVVVSVPANVIAFFFLFFLEYAMLENYLG